MNTTAKCPVKNGTYCCDLPEGHNSRLHGANVRHRRNGKTYERRAVWTSSYSPVKFSVATATR